MWGPVLALASATVYGVVDFTGGVLSRRVHYAVVAFAGQVSALVVATVLALAYTAPNLRAADLWWGALSGVGSGVTMLFLNRGVSRGAVSVVVPISAVTGVALSVVCGVVLLGDRPGVLVWAGIGLVIPALWWVSGGTVGEVSPAIVDGLIASCGVAVQYLALAQATTGSGLWPVATGRAAAIAVILLPAIRGRAGHTSRTDHARAAAIGAGATAALVLYLLATQQQQLLTVVVVLASLYPALPVALGVTVLHESITRRQILGLTGAGVAVVLLSLG